MLVQGRQLFFAKIEKKSLVVLRPHQRIIRVNIMKSKRLIINCLSQYNIDNDNHFLCMGNRQDCYPAIQFGGKQMAFGKLVDEGVTHIRLSPDIKKIKSCKNLDFLPKSLTNLSIPLPLLSFLDSEKLTNLQNIIITHSYKYDELNLDFDNIKLDEKFNLKSFSFIADDDDNAFDWKKIQMDLYAYKNLEYVGLNIDNRQEDLDYIAGLKQVKNFAILSPKNTDTLSCIPRTAEMIILSYNDFEKDLSVIKEFKDLKLLEINLLKSVFDCEWLIDLPNLQEVCLRAIFKINNINTLLNLSNLKSVTIVGCQNPFGKKKEAKDLFYNHGFLYLDIDDA